MLKSTSQELIRLFKEKKNPFKHVNQKFRGLFINTYRKTKGIHFIKIFPIETRFQKLPFENYYSSTGLLHWYEKTTLTNPADHHRSELEPLTQII